MSIRDVNIFLSRHSSLQTSSLDNILGSTKLPVHDTVLAEVTELEEKTTARTPFLLRVLTWSTIREMVDQATRIAWLVMIL